MRPPARLAKGLSRLRGWLTPVRETPFQQAAAVALGAFIGSTPLWGFHLGLSIALGWFFGLSPLKVYIAANISNPLVAPFLYAAEIQVGALIRRGELYSPAVLTQISMTAVLGDALVGCVVVGGALALGTGTLTYVFVNRRRLPPAVAALIDRAAARYQAAGVTAWEFASAKLERDPVYVAVLRQGLVSKPGTLVDLGCGQGLMLALIVAARELHAEGCWPDGWPPPPAPDAMIGVENRADIVEKARVALGDAATIQHGSLTESPLPRASAVLAFDVLHLLPRADQDTVLERIGDALEPGGVLILREADAMGGWRFLLVRAGNFITKVMQRQWRRRLEFRSAQEWRAALTALGFDVEGRPMGQGTPFANIIVVARKNHLVV